MTATPAKTVISDVARGYLRLQRVPDVGPIRAKNLLAHFGSVDAIFSASVVELERVEGVGQKVAEAVFRARQDDSVQKEIDKAAECGARILCAQDEEYPRLLHHIPDPPICLYVRGRIEPADAVAVAIVGTRRCSHYGREQALRFGEMLAQAGFTVVSGLARGIDGDAHRGALRAGGRTIAVLGCGLGTIYPPEHEELADEIAQRGAVVSELEIDIGPDSKNFPPRNRIIAGMSLGVLVVEAGQASGALITARLATEYNREVFALPGAVDRPAQNAGSNALIRESQAKLVTCLEDILDELGDVGKVLRPSPVPSPQELPPPTDLDASQRRVWDCVANGIEEFEGLCRHTQLDAGFLAATLTRLQLRGLVKQLPGNRFVCRSIQSVPRAAPLDAQGQGQARGPHSEDTTNART